MAPPKKKVKPEHKKPLSKRKVTCGECSKVFERIENLKQHFDTAHDGKPPYEKGQTKLHFGSPSTSSSTKKKRSVSENEDLLSPRSEDESPCDTYEISNLSPIVLSPSSPASPSLSSTHGSETGKGIVDPATFDFHSEISGNIGSASNEILIDNMKIMLEQLEINVCSSRKKIASPTLNSPTSPSEISLNTPISSPSATSPISGQKVFSKEELDYSEQLKLLSQCSSLKHIVNLLDDVFELNLEETHLECVFCHKPPQIGRFAITGVEYEKLSARSQKFRNLTNVLKKHLKSDHHQKNIKSHDAGARKRCVRNREMGRRIGTLSYFIYFNDLPFTFFTSFMPWFTLNSIDMGEVNHSTRFIENFVTPVYQVLVKRLQNILDEPLSCTGKPSPFAILGDKGTVKRDVTQPTLIRTVCLRKNNLFQTFYLSHPEVMSHKGKDVTELLISSVQTILSWSIGKIRERFCGGSFDGQYFHLNVPVHLANKLSLDQDFTKDSLTWDIAHRVELACEDAKKETNWLQQLDTTLQSIMKKFTMGKHHTDLRKILSFF